MEERLEFDAVTLLSAFAVGVPGKRTFFLAMGEREEWLRLWLEKEQLEALALAVDQLFLLLAQENVPLPKEAEGAPSSDDVSSRLPSAELDIDQITLGYEQGKAILHFLVHGFGSQREHPSAIYCWATLAQLKRLGRQAKSVCAAGRPHCPFCGGPVDPSGHICPANN